MSMTPELKYLRTPAAIRERAGQVLKHVEDGRSAWWSVDGNGLEAAIDCSTGSIGVAWVTTKARLMPMKTTSANWPSRVSRYLG